MMLRSRRADERRRKRAREQQEDEADRAAEAEEQRQRREADAASPGTCTIWHRSPLSQSDRGRAPQLLRSPQSSGQKCLGIYLRP